jgi:hypothetical protein
MKIILKPSDIIERALWYKYEYFILDGKTQKEIEEIIEKNEEFEIPERSALIIDLLKCIVTDNLKHRLNQHMLHLLNVKTTEISTAKKSNLLVINKNTINYELDRYSKNFPDSWKPTLNYVANLKELRKYIKKLKDKLQKLIIHEGSFQGNVIEYVEATHVKKMLDFNHG